MPTPIRPKRHCPELLAFEEIRRRLRLGTRLPAGRREVQVADIIGSVDRVADFDGCFQPRTNRLKALIRDLKADNPAAVDLPIALIQVDHAYFVADGHKRLSISIATGRTFVDAEVDRFETPFHVAPGTTMAAVRATHRELRFRETTGLDLAVPDGRFALSNPACYLELEESVKAHALDLSHSEGRLVSRAEGARHWFDTVFAPVLALAREMSASRLLESTTDADRFLLFRRGIEEPMETGWQIPRSTVEQGRANLAESTPGRWTSWVGSPANRGRAARVEPLPSEAPSRPDPDAQAATPDDQAPD
jgi:hypothetical protein